MLEVFLYCTRAVKLQPLLPPSGHKRYCRCVEQHRGPLRPSLTGLPQDLSFVFLSVQQHLLLSSDVCTGMTNVDVTSKDFDSFMLCFIFVSDPMIFYGNTTTRVEIVPAGRLYKEMNIIHHYYLLFCGGVIEMPCKQYCSVS